MENLSMGARGYLALDLFDYCYEQTETFKGQANIGADLAYLMGVILDINHPLASVDWSPEGYGERAPALLILVSEHYPPGHEIWSFIELGNRK